MSAILPNKTDVADAVNIIKNSKTKCDVHNDLVKKFSEKGKEIYQVVKSLLADKPGNCGGI